MVSNNQHLEIIHRYSKYDKFLRFVIVHYLYKCFKNCIYLKIISTSFRPDNVLYFFFTEVGKNYDYIKTNGLSFYFFFLLNLTERKELK